MIEFQQLNKEIKISKNDENIKKNENPDKKSIAAISIDRATKDPSKRSDVKNTEENPGSARDDERRFQAEKEQREREEINNKIKESKEKNLKSIMHKITSLSEVMIKKKIKIVDFILSLFIILNLVLALTQNNRFTSKILECEVFNNSTDIDKNKTEATKLYRYLYEEDEKITEMNNLRDLADTLTNCKTIKDEYDTDELTDILRWIIVGVIVIMEILLFARYRLKLKLLRSSFKACANDNFFTTGTWKGFLIEFLVLAVFTPPTMKGTFKGRMLFGAYIYSYDSIITFFVILKLYYFIRIYSNISIWTSERVIDIGVDNKISIGAHFAIKAQIKHTPYLAMAVMLSISIGIFGFMMRIFEYGYASDPGAAVGVKAVKNPNFKTYTDTFWVIIITMMTVGYGDIFPNTHLGRIIAFLSALFGMVLVSLLIVSLSYVVEFSPEEKKAHNLIKKFNANEDMKKFSAAYIKSIMKLFLLKCSDFPYQKINYTSKFSVYMQQVMVVKEIGVQFNKFRKIAGTHSIPTDEILSQLERKLEKDINVCGPKKFLIGDISETTKRITENEQHINNSVNFLKEKQDDLAAYLVKFNNINTGRETFNQQGNNNNFLETE